MKANGERPLRHRGTLENIAAYIDGNFRLDGAAQSVAQIQEAAGFPQGRKKGPLFNLIGEGTWEKEAVRMLIECASADQPSALAVDLSEHRSGGSAYEIFSIHVVCRESTSPIDWRRVRIEVEADEVDVEGRCRALTLELIEACRPLLSATQRQPGGRKLPVVANRQSLAENSPLRPALAKRGIEYALGVSEEYHAKVVVDPGAGYASNLTYPPVAFVDPHGVVRHGDGAAIALRDTHGSSGASLDEHLVQVGAPDERYFIAHGLVDPAPRAGGYQRARRSIEIAEVAARLPTSSLADPFGIASFNHPKDASWRRHMLLLSLYKRFELEVSPG